MTVRTLPRDPPGRRGPKNKIEKRFKRSQDDYAPFRYVSSTSNGQAQSEAAVERCGQDGKHDDPDFVTRPLNRALQKVWVSGFFDPNPGGPGGLPGGLPEPSVGIPKASEGLPEAPGT